MQTSARAGPVSRDDRASLGVRCLAYLLDSVVLFAFAMLFATAALLNVLLRTDGGTGHLSDSTEWTMELIFLGTVPAWFLLNVLLSARRGCTVGQYVVGLRLANEDGSKPTLRRLVGYWLALHPLFFHPIFAGAWALLAFLSVSLSGSTIIVVVALGVALLCVLGPLASFIFALGDPQHRALHDRIAGVKVVRLG